MYVYLHTQDRNQNQRDIAHTAGSFLKCCIHVILLSCESRIGRRPVGMEHIVLIAEDVIVDVVLLRRLWRQHKRLHERTHHAVVVRQLTNHLTDNRTISHFPQIANWYRKSLHGVELFLWPSCPIHYLPPQQGCPQPDIPHQIVFSAINMHHDNGPPKILSANSVCRIYISHLAGCWFA